jgi:hypothetical protein
MGSKVPRGKKAGFSNDCPMVRKKYDIVIIVRLQIVNGEVNQLKISATIDFI